MPARLTYRGPVVAVRGAPVQPDRGHGVRVDAVLAAEVAHEPEQRLAPIRPPLWRRLVALVHQPQASLEAA